jgi:ERF superfamily
MNEILVRDRTIDAGAPAPSGGLLTAIIAASENPAVDVTKLEALMKMQERLEDRQAEREFNAAMTRLAGKMPTIDKKGTIEFTDKKGNDRKTPFARYEDIDTVIRPHLIEEGMSVSFTSKWGADGVTVFATLAHHMGHSTTAEIRLPMDSSGSKNPLQAMGSSLSYGKRYLVCMLLNIVTRGEDDDGKRGGSRFITDDQAATIRDLMRQAGRQEGPFLDRLFSGGTRSVEEISADAFVVVKNTLDGILAQRAKKEAG